MAWKVLAEGNLSEFQAAEPEISELPKGTRIKLEIDTGMWPIAPLADLWGAEWVAQRIYNETGAEIIDVEGVGWNKIIVWMRGSPVPVIPLIYVIAAVIIIAGLAYIVHEIRLSIEAAPIGVPLLLGSLAAGGLLLYALKRRAS